MSAHFNTSTTRIGTIPGSNELCILQNTNKNQEGRIATIDFRLQASTMPPEHVLGELNLRLVNGTLYGIIHSSMRDFSTIYHLTHLAIEVMKNSKANQLLLFAGISTPPHFFMQSRLGFDLDGSRDKASYHKLTPDMLENEISMKRAKLRPQPGKKNFKTEVIFLKI